MAVDPDAIEREILHGLPNEKKRRDAARVAADYFALRGEQYVEKREAEDPGDYESRRKQAIPITRRIVRTLAKHLYRPGPVRQVQDDEAATDWLNEVYDDNLANSLWQRADAHALLAHASAFQVAATGDATRPLRLHLWQAHEFAVYPDVGEPEAVVTVALEDHQRTYTLYTAEEIRVYRTRKWSEQKTNAAVVPLKVGEMPNPYGVLPFAFVHAELPTAEFWCGGIGDHLVTTEAAINDQVSDLALAIKRFLTPIGVAENCDVQLNPINKMGAFVVLMSKFAGLENIPPARLSYLQAQLDIVGAWHHIENEIYQQLDTLEIPRAAFRMDQPAAPSGVAILAEQLPLVEYAQERREPFRKYETDLGRACFAVYGAFYGDAHATALAADLPLVLTWPMPANPLPGPDRDASDQAALDMGMTSRVMLIQERYGLTRDQALARLRQIAKDKAEADAIDPLPDPMALDAQGGQGGGFDNGQSAGSNGDGGSDPGEPGPNGGE